MESDKKNITNLNKAVADGETWMLNSGLVTREGHKKLKTLLKTSIKGLKKLEYFLDDNSTMVNVTLYFGFWRLLFTNTSQLADNVMNILNECLPDYEISIQIKRYKKGM